MMTEESYQRRILELVEETVYYRQSAARAWMYAALSWAVSAALFWMVTL